MRPVVTRGPLLASVHIENNAPLARCQADEFVPIGWPRPRGVSLMGDLCIGQCRVMWLACYDFRYLTVCGVPLAAQWFFPQHCRYASSTGILIFRLPLRPEFCVAQLNHTESRKIPGEWKCDGALVPFD